VPSDSRAAVVVVGAGPSGAVLSLRLAQAGLSVICLEQGEWPRFRAGLAAEQAGTPGVQTPAFSLEAVRDLDGNPSRRRSSGDYPIDESASDITPIMWNGVGGGSVAYLGQWTRSLPSDFRVRTLDGVADDWPLTYAELEPYYARVEADFRISGTAGDPAYPAGNAPPYPAVRLPEGALRVAEAHRDLGWHWWPGSNALHTGPGEDGCTDLGVCRFGCPRDAKGSAHRTHWPRALGLGVRLITGAHVHRVETDTAGRATGVLYVSTDGVQHRVHADAVVLAGNGIGTPRLLLASASNRFPDGLANSSGLVGRRLMMHPFGTVVGLFDDELGTGAAAWGQLLYSLQFYETDPARGFVRGAKWGLVPTGRPETITRSYPWGERPIWGASFHEEVARRFNRSIGWGIIAEDLPDEDNYVDLSPALTDRWGMPAPAVHYRLSENSRAILEFNLARAAESLTAAGARETIVAPLIRESGWHILGTCVMGTDPARSVVDRFGRTHDVPNLFVADGSVWPTSSGTNPTATVAAMALRQAEHLVATMRVAA
jgi:choline dehydrogenase-like flavoprotein